MSRQTFHETDGAFARSIHLRPSIVCDPDRPHTTREARMPRNMGPTDRRARALIAAVAAIVGVLVGPAGVLSIVLYGLAGIMLATSAVGFCPVYPLVGVSTCRARGGPGASA
jgi:hypothetical protein